MREILFRGKRDDNGQWIKGYYCGPGQLLDVHEICDIDDTLMTRYEIDPETLGQFTGLTDKKGKKIFEGDILQYFDDEIQVVEWSDEFARIMLHTFGEREQKQGRKIIKVKHEGWNDLDDYPLEKMPILGNIHDNPELLEGKA